MANIPTISVPFARFSNSEIGQYTSTTLKAIDKTKIKLSEHAQLSQSVTRLTLLGTEFEDLLQQEHKVTAKTMHTADKTRTTDVKNIILQVKLAQSSRNTNKKAAADELAEVLKPYGNIARDKAEKKTSRIRGLIARLDKAPLKEKITLVGAKEWLDNLKLSQEEYYQLYLTYGKQLKKAKTKSIGQLRLELIDQHQKVYKFLHGFVGVDPTSPLKQVLLSINQVRKDYAETINRRNKKIKSKNDKNKLTIISPTATKKKNEEVKPA